MPTSIQYDLTPYIDAVRRFRKELIDHAAAKKDFPIKRIFQLLPVVIETPGGREALENRGDGLFRFVSDTFVSDSKTDSDQSITFKDDELGRIPTEIPRVVSFSYKPSGDGSVTLTSIGPSRVKINGIEHLDIPNQFVKWPLTLSSFAISDTTMITWLLDKAGQEIKIDGEIDGSLFSAARLAALFVKSTSQQCGWSWDVQKKVYDVEDPDFPGTPYAKCWVVRSDYYPAQGDWIRSFGQDEKQKAIEWAKQRGESGCSEVTLIDNLD